MPTTFVTTIFSISINTWNCLAKCWLTYKHSSLKHTVKFRHATPRIDEDRDYDERIVMFASHRDVVVAMSYSSMKSRAARLAAMILHTK